MKIDDLDGRMRAFESALDPTVLPGVYMVARLDGRGFTRLTKEVHPFEKPFDPRFHDFMRRAAEHLMAGCGLGVEYSFTQSTVDIDESPRSLHRFFTEGPSHAPPPTRPDA